ncbi:uncharacterized protein A4U43_C01F19010 [Asparagus officinalis]|uniref:Uncharacterized protein n=1 Tax=Asparagus officinalis TaxID=4686 RepID=A0A5P1FQG9_ASPOF|nr:uncharacterized protein A4U43_C01F19010 [Asparagus officinalis]
MIESLKALVSQKSAEINKLKHKVHEQNKRIRYLSEEYRKGAHLLNALKNLEGEDPATAKWGSTMRPQKRLRRELDLEELKMVAAKTTKFTNWLARSSATTQADKSDNRRRRLSRGRESKG